MEETEEKKNEDTSKEVKREKKRARKALERLSKIQRGFFSDFKAFINKGNIVQLAVAFIMGAAFTAIVTSLVNDIFMPFIGLIFNGTDIGSLTWTFSNGFAIVYGQFILAVVNFLLVALILFFIVKLMTRAENELKALKKVNPEKAEQAAAPTLTKTEEILIEIREILKYRGEDENN